MIWSRRQFIHSSVGAAAVAVSGAPASPQSKSFVKAHGKDLVSPNGETLHLRGINLGNWFEPEGYMFLFDKGPQSPREIEGLFNELIGPSAAREFWREYRGQYITEADIQLIRRSGLNSVRIPLHYKFFDENGEGFPILDTALGWCREASVWAILDMHCAPGGQTGTNIDDSWNYPWLYESDHDQRLLCDIWRRIAERYRNESIVLGYDLLNEPIPHFPQLQKYNSRLEPLYKRVTKAIREVDKNHIIILEAAQWDTNFKVFGPPFDSNLIYEFHKYWTPPTQDAIQEYLDFRDRYKVPIWLGESGENTDDWIHKFRSVLEQNGVGWCFWPYKKMEKSSCMVSIAKPVHWDEITRFAQMPRGAGNAERVIASRPSLEHSKEAVQDLLQKIRLDSCRVNAGYFEALGLKR